MDHAPLRPVPIRPDGPVSDPDAARHVSVLLPELAERDGLALALVALAGHPREAVARRLGMGSEELALALARSRKALRRSLAPLPGSGWCERAERLVSDRLDEALSERDEPRLAAHLRNCPRCVDHERRLVHATDALLGGVPAAPPVPLVEAVEPEPAPAPVSLEAEPELDSVAGWYAFIAACLALAIVAIVLVIAGAFGAA